MALHHHLPIYKVAYQLFDLSTDLAKNMPRDFKVTIGGRIVNEGIDIMVLIFRANVARDKNQHLLDLIERLQVAELLLRAARDKRLISLAKYAMAVDLTDSIGKQAGGWRRSANSPAS